jgi:hypothetical protein
MTCAQIILNQLGGNRFLTMTGAKALVAGEHSLMFSLPARFAKDGINKVRIELDPADTYTLTAWKMSRHGLDLHEKAARSGIYADDLQDIFTQITGLDTHL